MLLFFYIFWVQINKHNSEQNIDVDDGKNAITQIFNIKKNPSSKAI